MVLSASNANNFTANSIVIQTNAKLAQEVDLTERSIRNATGREKYHLVYDARVVGNPFSDIQDDTTLTQLQIAYRDAFIAAGYLVTRDSDSGLWRFDWEARGIESLVSVYSIRTTVVPGAIIPQTIAAIDTYFAAQVPVVNSITTFINLAPGGDILEGDFGATNSVYYEYTAVVRQQDATVNFNSGLRTALIATPLGYLDAPSNVAVYKVA